MGTEIESPGALVDFQGTVEQYTGALSRYRTSVMSPEILDVKILHVPDQGDIQKLQNRGVQIG